MSIVVMILLVGKRGLFWIVYNNYSMKAVLKSFELYLSIIRASKNNDRQTCHRKIAISHDCFEINGSKKLLSFHCVRLPHSTLTRVMSF